jgi:hypothetical protein
MEMNHLFQSETGGGARELGENQDWDIVLKSLGTFVLDKLHNTGMQL